MQSSSLLPASSVRSFRVHAPRPAPPLTLVASIVLIMLGCLAGAVALDWTDQPWLDSVVSSLRGALPWNWASEADDALNGPIAMPVRVPLDPVLAAETAPFVVAEAPAPGSRRDSDGGALRAGGATGVGVVSPSVAADGVGSGSATVAPAASDSAAVGAGAPSAAPPSASDGGATPSAADAAATAASPTTGAAEGQ
jgi:hypothetical protein